VQQRRQDILDHHVPFIAYQRPRHVDLLIETPYRDIEPGFTESPVPGCLKADRVVPREVRAMVDLFKDVPIRWFVRLPPLLHKLDRLDSLRETAVYAKHRAQVKTQTAAPVLAASGVLGKAISKTYTAQISMTNTLHLQTAALDLSLLSQFTWQQTRDFVAKNATLGDLIEGGHGKSDVARQALRELDDTAQVAGCLYEAFGRVEPVLRLKWAEIISQYDAPVNLRNLMSLPDFGKIEVLERRTMQAMVDWLFNSVDQTVPPIIGLINDLVRVCILLASHAPVNQIIAGKVTKPATVGIGGRLTLAADLSRVHIGMPLFVYDKVQKDRVVAKAVVEDLDSGAVAAKVVQMFTETLSVDTDTVVQFSESDTVLQMAAPLSLFT
jgi:hypothetical protein